MKTLAQIVSDLEFTIQGKAKYIAELQEHINKTPDSLDRVIHKMALEYLEDNILEVNRILIDLKLLGS